MGFDEKPTFVAFGESPLHVMTGGGLSGFAGVVIYRPQSGTPTELTLDLENNSTATFGVRFSYNDTARIHVNGRRKWTNTFLSDGQQGRQHISETGMLRVELFDSKELKEYIARYRDSLRRLGIIFGP
jgi:hypothetical protein